MFSMLTVFFFFVPVFSMFLSTILWCFLVTYYCFPLHT